MATLTCDRPSAGGADPTSAERNTEAPVLKIVRLASCVGGCTLLGLAGCSSPRSPHSEGPVDLASVTGFWKPYLLYTKADPYSRLYVEVDAVEGRVPDDKTLGRLRDFLTAHCDKPNGIQIVRNTVISREEARGIPARALARKQLSGPPPDPRAPPGAFMYILFFDAPLSLASETNSNRQTARAEPPGGKTVLLNPHTELLPYPAAIFADPLFGGHFPDTAFVWELFGPVINHEAGHLLGLARSSAHSSKLHCQDKLCFMHLTHSPWELLTGTLPADFANSEGLARLRLCVHCEAEIRAQALQPGPSNLRFVGPVLVRSEAGYQVMILPGRLELVVGSFDDQDAWNFLRAVQREPHMPMVSDPLRIIGTVKSDALQDQLRLRKTLERASRDPYEAAREVARHLRQTGSRSVELRL